MVMDIEHAIPHLDAQGLRRFAFTTGAIVGGVFGLLIPTLLGRPWPLWPWVIVALLAAPALFAPMWLRPVYHSWMRFGLLASRVTTPLILGTVYFLVISPIALARRLMRRDAMGRCFDSDIVTYRVAGERRPRDSLRNPF